MPFGIFSPKSVVADVTDTAPWMAALRADETKRSDAVIQDPLASMLAGARGVRIARSIPDSTTTGWAVALRTSAIDTLVEAAVQRGVDTVVNLGSGLDARPYRMILPSRIRWIEIDFPNLIEFKDSALRGYQSRCHVERIGLNLLDRSARNTILKTYSSRDARTLLIAEGVIPYFSNEDVASLANDLREWFQSWILDFENVGKRPTPKNWVRPLERAPFLFQPHHWFQFFEECGWHVQKVITTAEESARLNRPYPLSFPRGLVMRALPGHWRHRILSMSGVALMGTAIRT